MLLSAKKKKPKLTKEEIPVGDNVRRTVNLPEAT